MTLPNNNITNNISLEYRRNESNQYLSRSITPRAIMACSIRVYDVGGKEIETPLNEDVQQGEHPLQLNTAQFSKGVYLIKMITDYGIVHGTPYGENQKLIVQ